jgi:hypothetical protein
MTAAMTAAALRNLVASRETSGQTMVTDPCLGLSIEEV